MAETTESMKEWQKLIEEKPQSEIMEAIRKAASEARVDLLVSLCKQEKSKESVK